MTQDEFGHLPVLPNELLELLNVTAGDTMLDATVGTGGHAALFGQVLGPNGTLVGLDVDPDSLDRAKRRLDDCPCTVRLFQANFREVQRVASEIGIPRFDAILADLGVSSPQLDTPERGFSFREEAPLDMRLDPTLTTTASDLVNRLSERELADLIFYNSQEMKSRRIARKICEMRRISRITTTTQLSEIVCKALRVADPNSRKAKIHPATRTFQALRMAVNDETGALQKFLDAVPDLLNPGGRVGIIAFHSVEDKPVKLDFRRRKSDGVYDIVTKKPVIAEEEERLKNPRSRSAKLRVAQKTDNA